MFNKTSQSESAREDPNGDTLIIMWKNKVTLNIFQQNCKER